MPLFKSLSSKSIQEYKVAVWRISETEQELRNGLTLSEISIERLSRLKSEGQRNSFLAVRQLLWSYGISDEQLFYSESGKPFLKDGPAVSISHTTAYAAIALGFNVEVGVDIERHREQIFRIASRFSNEGALSNVHSKQQHLEKLTALWGAKEAIYKIVDQRGLSFKNDILVDDFTLESHHSSARVGDRRFHFTFETFDRHTLVYGYQTKSLR